MLDSHVAFWARSLGCWTEMPNSLGVHRRMDLTDDSLYINGYGTSRVLKGMGFVINMLNMFVAYAANK
jgi:hypothetical protein